MTSVLKVDNIQNSSGTAAISIDSSGRVTQPKLPHVAVDFGESDNTFISYTAGNKLPFDNVYEGDSSLWDTTNYEFTASIGGVYMISIGLLNNSAATIDIDVYVNDTRVLRQGQAASGRYSDLCFAKVLSANDVVHFEASLTENFHGGSGDNRHSYVSITFLG